MIPLAIVGAVVGFIGLTVGTILWRGYVLAILWGWFAVPAFGLPQLTIAQAIGVSIVVGMLTHQGFKDDRELGPLVALALLGPLVSLLIGWIVKGYLP